MPAQVTPEEVKLNETEEVLAKVDDKKLSEVAQLILERDYGGAKDAKSLLEQQIKKEIDIFRERPIGLIIALLENGVSLKDLRNLSIVSFKKTDSWFEIGVSDASEDDLTVLEFPSKRESIEFVALCNPSEKLRDALSSFRAIEKFITDFSEHHDNELPEIRNKLSETERVLRQELDFYKKEFLASFDLVKIENRVRENLKFTYEDPETGRFYMSTLYTKRQFDFICQDK